MKLLYEHISAHEHISDLTFNIVIVGLIFNCRLLI